MHLSPIHSPPIHPVPRRFWDSNFQEIASRKNKRSEVPTSELQPPTGNTKMGTITDRAKAKGKPSFTAQIRKKKKGKILFTMAETFGTRSAAQTWIKRQETMLKAPGVLERAAKAKSARPWQIAFEIILMLPPKKLVLPRHKCSATFSAWHSAICR